MLVVKKNILTLITVSPYITASNETEIPTEREQMKAIKVDELPLELRNQLLKENGVSTRNYSMKIDDVRREAIAVLNVIKSHSQKNRVRILNHALKTNEV